MKYNKREIMKEARALLAQLHEEAERDSEVLSGYIPLFDD